MKISTDDIRDVHKQRFFKERFLTRTRAARMAPRKDLAVELYAGNGGMSQVLLRVMKKTITNDLDKKTTAQYHLTAEKFAEEILPTLGRVDLLDFDAYGNPNLAIQKAFETIDRKSLPFTICYTDGLGLAMKFNSKVDLNKFYLMNKKIPRGWRHMKLLSYHFITELAKKHNWKARLKCLLQSKNKNFVFGTWLIYEV